jgi:hypothetical protein
MTFINDQSREKVDRHKVIIDFIRSHPFCNVQSVVQGVENDISRVTVFKLLRELIESGAVKRHLENNQKRNARDHKLFVEESNPLVSVRLELEKFEKAYFNLFDKAIIEYEKLIEALLDAKDVRIKLLAQPIGLFRNLMDIFYSMVDACLFCFLFIWSQKISDKQVLQQLYSMVFSKIADMQTRLSEGVKSTQQMDIDIVRLMAPFIQKRFRGSEGSKTLVEYLDSFKELKMEKEIEPVIDSLWKIFGDLQPYVYPEPRTYRWPFKYGEDDGRKLVNLLRQHPESTPFRLDLDLFTEFFKSELADVEKEKEGMHKSRS